MSAPTPVLGSVEAALAAIDGHDGNPETFSLLLSNDLSYGNQPIAHNLAMAMITDRVLKRRWEPTGFEGVTGGRRYSYRSWG